MRRLLLCLILLLAMPAAAHASSTQESTFQDDNKLLYAPPEQVKETLNQLASLGADRLRLTLLWEIVAPSPSSERRPNFDALDPEAYGAGAWDRYDLVIREAAARGLKINLNPTAPAPRWATQKSPDERVQNTYMPDPLEFGKFVAAAGKRYSGTHVPGLPYGNAGAAPLPRVDYWTIWNEPNQSGWLTPQWSELGGGAGFIQAAPRLYRELADQAYVGLVFTGHTNDTILVGETAPKGTHAQGIKRFLKPIPFIRILYCLDDKLRPMKGSVAKSHGCREDGNYKQFAKDHPILFQATGFAHHPYNLIGLPSLKPSDKEFVTLSALSRLTKVIDRAVRLAGTKRKLPLYLTEYGYQTNPPDSFGVSFKLQAAFMDESEWMTYKNPRVRTLSQFLLVDDAPIANFQTGLITVDGKRKPAYNAYKLPVHVLDASIRKGARLKVWGMLRSAPNTRTPKKADLQYRTKGKKSFERVSSKTTRNVRGYFEDSFKPLRSGTLRISYKEPGARAATRSREVSITVLPAKKKTR